jgi:hypothetical protein
MLRILKLKAEQLNKDVTQRLQQSKTNHHKGRFTCHTIKQKQIQYWVNKYTSI